MNIRAADPGTDAAACAAIYAPYVDGSVISFELEPPGAGEMAERIEAAHVWLVAEVDGEVVGYAYAGEHRSRAAYRWTTEVTVYVASDRQRAGIGRALYGALLDEARRRRFRLAVAGITLPNDASVGIHKALGFEPVGVYKAIGWKDGSWHDVGWWQLDLQPDAPDVPEEPLRS